MDGDGIVTKLATTTLLSIHAAPLIGSRMQRHMNCVRKAEVN